ncbi:hypothetical protein CJF30_00011262 [Rutstroemia sp. NJR-2017a BBW]|nr:hypothetical protein CJF30_00011262 [Rutstroemia sp. NJR-2017a BBW]
MRTGRIGLAYFLNTAKVPDFPTKQYEYGQGWETPRYILLYFRQRVKLEEQQVLQKIFSPNES